MRKKVKDIIKMLEADGWYLKNQRGSHRQYSHQTKPGKVTVPDHGKNHELDHFVVASILKQADLK
ncbi:type II toxin-antitoxin system HicA family toxin [Rhabdobacter roseus]|uniref:Putative RNA binding protein YcfA (HicA-like mRNA interferase family) n=1 Tax=Rhabdobacter roseus TaxID=1655419 RepID=A0A840TQ78_9BACT|nr:type II toxin-antitoxin system HicA family toxin [Rhabdobacter roseus]MBB5283393.1 putative RNA binding protein YcfA (HicA-like mRNA interferase family) [Rhabdobacter roseus]